MFSIEPEALNEFVTVEEKLGILSPRSAEPGEVFYNGATQEAKFEFDETFGARLYPYNDNIFGVARYGFSNYGVVPTDVDCLEALGLAPSQFANQSLISDAYAARTVSDPTTFATLQIMQSSCVEQKSFDEFIEDVYVLFEQHEDFTLSNLAGRYVYAFFDVAMSRVAGEAGLQLRNRIGLMEINAQGEQVSNSNYRELLSGAINGSAPEVFVSTESPVEVLPFTIPTDQQTGLPATDGSLNYNFRAFPTSPEISVFPAYLSRDNNILATRYIDSNGNDNGIAGMGLGFRIDPNAALVAGDLVDRRFEVWGFRARQEFEGDALNSLSFTNLDGLAFTFEQVGDDVIAQVQLGFDVKRLADFGRLEVVPADNRVVSSSPVTVSAAGEIQFQVEDNGEDVIFTGFLGADGAILFVLQGVTGQADPIVDAEPNKTSFSSVTTATAAIGVALPIVKEIAREILAGDFQFNVVGENLTSTITIPECPDVPGFFDYTFSETAITFTGTDGWTTPECIPSPITTETLEVSSLTPALDLPFNCVDYPVCRRADFDRLIAGRDENNDLFVQTYEYDIENNSVISIKTEENGSFTEIIDL